MAESRARRIAAACIIAAGFCFLAAIYSVSMTNADAAKRDFIGYWAAGQQMAHGASPFDAAAVLKLEQAAGLGGQEIKLTPSPPAGLSLMLPLGYMGAKAGLVFWMMVQLACLAASVAIVWLLMGRPASRIHLFGFLFAPAVACIMAGQVGIFCLLGVALFLYLQKTHPFWAGAALLPCSLKPHLFLPVMLVLLLWSVTQRSVRVLAGFVVALATSDALVTWFDPQVWSQYFAMIHTGGLQGRFAPTLSAYLRWDVAAQVAGLEYLPTILACLWAVWFFWSRRARWSWTNDGMVVLLVSVMCAPYAWITDESVLLPAVLFGVYRALGAKRSLIPIVVFAGVALVELLSNIRITSWYYTWTTAAWLLWYLYATRIPSREQGPVNAT